jgi:RimJ/RimL family protein N-acetyltransferase
MSFAVIYRWRLTPGLEERFAAAWGARTARIQALCGSYGAQLHRGEDGVWLSYARWPSAEARDACFADLPDDEDAAAMRGAIAERLPEIVMELVDDRLREPSQDAWDAPPLPRRPIAMDDGLALRPLDPRRDAEALHAVFGDPASSAFMPFAAEASIAETGSRLARLEAPSSPQWVIVRDDGPALGRITLIGRRKGVAEIGIQVVPAEQGKGLARRAVCAVTAYALDELGLVRVAADVDPDNGASARVFERAGFAFEGRQKNTWITHTGVWDSLIFAATTGWKPP